jgi:hypothetical protein
VDVYQTEVAFYRRTLRISYELGSRLRANGILVPDAKIDDGRPLYSLEAAAVERHKEALSRYKIGIRRARENVYG